MDLFGLVEEKIPETPIVKPEEKIVQMKEKLQEIEEPIAEIKSETHEKIFQKITNLFKKNRLHHSNIFYGTQGIGKMALALNIAKFILTFDAKSKSKSLNLIEKNTHPDLLIITNENQITVDEIRAINQFTSLKPSYSNCKIIIINKIDYLNQQAANAMLKLLEDPQDDIYYFLISDDLSKIIQTVRSRSVVTHIENLEFSNFFKDEEISKLSLMDAKILKEFSNCSINFAKKLQNENILENLAKILEFILKKDLKPSDIDEVFVKSSVDFLQIKTIILYATALFNPANSDRILIPSMCKKTDEIKEFLNTHRKKTAAKIIGKYFQNYDEIIKILSQKETFNLDQNHAIYSCIILLRNAINHS